MPHSAAKSRRPRYQQLADDLRVAIAGGQFPDGFPTEQVLTERYKMSRFTVREALKTLQTEGLISRRRGSGTTIEAAQTRGGALHQPLSNVGEVLQYARDTKFEITWRGFAPVQTEFADAIGLDDRSTWVALTGLRSDAGGTPIAANQVYLIPELEAAAEQLTADGGTIFSQLERLAGIKVARVTQDIQARPADDWVAPQLQIYGGEPTLRIIRCYIDRDDRIFEISVSHHPGDRFAYSVHFEADG